MSTTHNRCATCGRRIVYRRSAAGATFWYHDRGEEASPRWQRACGWAEPKGDA